MFIKILSFSSTNKELLKSALSIRFAVFSDELGIDKDIEFDGLDFEATHYVISVNDKPVATARWRETNEGIKIERLAVLKDYRSLGLGQLLMRYIIRDLIPSKRPIYLHAQKYVVNFYKILHFKPVGKEFEEAGILHQKMFYKR